MITRRNRFHGHHSVSKVRGSLLHSTNFTLRFATSKKQNYRLCVVVSKKVDKRAVTRNRIRRRIYEIFRTQSLLDNLTIDVVVYVKNVHVAKIPHSELSDEIIKLTKTAVVKTSS